MSARIAELAASLEAGGTRTAAFFRALAPEQLATQLYTDGAQWTVRQVLAHFVVIERSMMVLFEDIRAGGPGDTGVFDLERFNRSQPKKLDDVPLSDLIERFEASRAKTVAFVRESAEADLDRQGRHPFLGEGSLEQFIRWADEHARRHEADITQTLGL